MPDSRNRVVVVVAPTGKSGLDLREAALSWIADGLIRPILWVPDIGAIQNLNEDTLLPAQILGAGGIQEIDLFQHLGSFVVERMELICPWYLGSNSPDIVLANQAVKLHKALQAILPQTVQKVNGKVEKRLVRSLLSIPTNEKQTSFDGDIDYRQFDHHIVVSPEVRALPWSGSAPLKSDSRFPFFVIAQIAGVGGLWSGFDRSLSSLLEERDHQTNPGEVLMLRTIASVVLAHGVSNRVAKEALRRVADPRVSVFSEVSEREISRPRAIDSRNADLIQSEINRKFDAALRIAGRNFAYFADSGDPDDGHSWRVTLNLLVAFTKTRLASFWPYTVRWLKNVRSRIFKKLDSRTRIDEIELPIGVDEELSKKVDSVNKLLADRKGQDAVAAATVSLQANPELWKNLRYLTYSALDGGYSVGDGEQAVVLPAASLLVPDPDDRFEIDDPEILEFFELGSSKLTFAQVSDLRGKLNEYLESANSETSNQNKANTSDTSLAVSEPAQSEHDGEAPELDGDQSAIDEPQTDDGEEDEVEDSQDVAEPGDEDGAEGADAGVAEFEHDLDSSVESKESLSFGQRGRTTRKRKLSPKNEIEQGDQ